MKSLALLLPALALAARPAVGWSVNLPSTTVPALLWSDKDVFTGRTRYVTETLSTANLRQLIDGLAGDNTESEVSHLLSKSRPNVATVVAFVAEEVGTNELSQLTGAYQPGVETSHLQSLVEQASSSVVLPFVLPQPELSLSSAQTLTIPSSEVLSFLESDRAQSFLSRPSLKLLEVSLGTSLSFKEADELLGKVCERLQGRAGVFLFTSRSTLKNVLSLTAVAAESRRLAEVPKGEAECGPGQMIGIPRRGGRTFCFDRYVWMTPDILAALLISLFLIATALCGVRCIGAIQTPTRFVMHPLAPGKEY